MSERAAATADRHTAWTDESPDAHLLGLGAIAQIERRLADHYDLPYAVATSSATTALHGLALALGLKSAEFITTPYTWGGSLAGWLLCDNRVRFADVEPGTLTLDARALRARLTSRVRSVLAVDADGVPCDMVALRSVADEAGVPLVIDAAQSLGARIGDGPASRLADAVVVSFTSRKPVSAGEGGAVLTADRDLYERLIWWTQHPLRQRRELGLRVVNEFGLNGRMHPAAARHADAVFDDAMASLAATQRIGLRVCDVLRGSGLVTPWPCRERRLVPTFFRFTAQWCGRPAPEQLVAVLRDAGIDAGIDADPVRPLYTQPAFLSLYAGDRGHLDPPVPVMKAAARNGVRLLVH